MTDAERNLLLTVSGCLMLLLSRNMAKRDSDLMDHLMMASNLMANQLAEEAPDNEEHPGCH